MATTSSTLAAGTAIAGQGGTGKWGKGRVGGLVATAALGVSLLAGGVIGHARRAAAPAAPQVSVSASANTRPVDASTTGAFRWDFGEQPLLALRVPAGYRVSAPNEHEPGDATASTGAPAYCLSPPNELDPALP